MNKKGFTLFEVIISVILVSILLTSMLATLVKIRQAYSIVYENTDALIFSSSISRIINNDFQENGGIRYIDCNYNGDLCDITLNNDQKRRIEIYNIYTGHLVTEADNLNYYIAGSGSGIKIKESDGIYCEPTLHHENHQDVSKVIAECSKATDDNTSSIMCICENQLIRTTLRYSDQTDPNNENNIYLKTLSANKMSGMELDNGKYKATGQKTVSGYNFGRMTFTNMVFDSSNKKTTSGAPYKNSISTLSIEINDGLDTQDTTYNINLTSTSSFSPEKIQMGKELIFKFDNSTEEAAEIKQRIKELHIKFGVGFYVMTNENELIEVRKLTNDADQAQIPTDITNKYVFDGYYYPLEGGGEIKVIDSTGNFLVTSTYFEKDKDSSGNTIFLKAKWNLFYD